MESLEQIVSASHHVYRQQYQVARFLQQTYAPGARIAVNDIGAIAYGTDADVLDLWGLGTIEVTRAKRTKAYDVSAVARLLSARRTEAVIVHKRWFMGADGVSTLPSNLVTVGRWSVESNYFERTVTFFGASQEDALVLEKRLRAYEPNLPRSVTATYGKEKR
jgi:hypothetical protein